MAIHAPITGAPSRAPAFPTPIAAVLSRFDREQLAGFIAVAIDLLDMAGGDPDLEDDDPAGGNITDEPHDPEEHGADPSTWAVRRPHRDRIRRTACSRVDHPGRAGGWGYPGWSEYFLLDPSSVSVGSASDLLRNS